MVLQSNITEEEEKTCIGHGISVCKELEDIRKQKKRFPRKFKNAKIAKSVLTSECGLIKQTGSLNKSHYTWWLPPNVEVWHFFVVIEQQ